MRAMPERERNEPVTSPEPAGNRRLAKLDFQHLWFQVQHRDWSSLVVVPADADIAAAGVATSLWKVGCALSTPPPQLINCEKIGPSAIADLIADLSRSLGSAKDVRTVISIESVLSNPLGVGIARAADAVLLCVRKRQTKLDAARRTIELIGRQRFIGSVVLSRP